MPHAETMSAPRELVAWIGLDWADQHHDLSLLEAGATRVERKRIAHSPEALSTWLVQLRQRFGGRPVGICLEQSRGGLIHALMQHDFLVLYPINPATMDRFRKAFASSGAKDDPSDADLLLELLVKHRDRLRAWVPEDPDTRALARLVEARRKAVQLRTRLVQQLTAELKGYFPQALSWAGTNLSTEMAVRFLLRWPTLEAVQRAHFKTLRQFYYRHHCRRPALVEKRLEEIRTATPLTHDPAIVKSSALVVQMLARQLQALTPSILRYEEEIEALFRKHPDAALFAQLPGSGASLAPRLLVAFGSDRSRFGSAREVQQYSGIAPVTVRSGKSQHVHCRYAAPRFLRQTFHEFAGHSIRYSVWARAYYEQMRERGRGHQAAVRALAFKWIRILWRCWQDRSPYQEAHHVRALRERGSPLAERITAVTAAAA